MISLKIIFTALAFAICYGIIHDMVTAHICVEYFTIGHPKIIASQSPVVLALLWGVLATWWMGLAMGGLIAGFSQSGTNPPLQYTYVRKLIQKLVLCMLGLAVLAGITGFLLAKSGSITLEGRLGYEVPAAKHIAFLTDVWIHSSSYLSAFIGTLLICRVCWKKRNI